MTDSVDALALETIVKTYGATVALGGATIRVAAGEVHALLGENGAGKSTTVKLLSGLIRPSSGEIRVFGRPAVMARPSDAHRLGIQTAFQEISLVPDLTVAETMLMPYAPRGRWGLLRRREGEAAIRAHLDRIGLSDIDTRAEVRALDCRSARRSRSPGRCIGHRASSSSTSRPRHSRAATSTGSAGSSPGSRPRA